MKHLMRLQWVTDLKILYMFSHNTSFKIYVQLKITKFLLKYYFVIFMKNINYKIVIIFLLDFNNV